jgi:hypothetical protein
MPLLAVDESTASHVCLQCGKKSEISLDSLTLGVKDGPDNIPLPICECGAIEILLANRTPSAELEKVMHDSPAHMHHVLVRAVGSALQGMNRTHNIFIAQEPLSAETRKLAAQTERSEKKPTKRRGGG